MEAVLHWCYGIQMVEETVVEVADSDARLMLRFKEGDAEAFEQLFSRHTRAVINFAYRFVRNRGMAEELAQEIFMRVYEAAPGYQAQAKFTTWLYRIAANVCLNEIRKPHFRSEEKWGRLPISETENWGRLPISETEKREASLFSEADAELQRQAISRALRDALEQIPEKQRIAFILNKYQELSYAEVAEVMQIGEKAVKSLIHRAKETLAEKLKPLLPELINI